MEHSGYVIGKKRGGKACWLYIMEFACLIKFTDAFVSIFACWCLDDLPRGEGRNYRYISKNFDSFFFLFFFKCPKSNLTDDSIIFILFHQFFFTLYFSFLPLCGNKRVFLYDTSHTKNSITGFFQCRDGHSESSGFN